MIHVICSAGHHTPRPAMQEFAADPRCYELTSTGFCAAHAWQDHTTVSPGDMVALLDGRRIVRAAVDSWNHDPDRHAFLVDEMGITHQLYVGSWYTPGMMGPFGQPLWRQADAEHMRHDLSQILKEARKGRQDAKKAIAQAELERYVSRAERPTARGHAEPFDVPMRLFDDAQDCHESPALAFYLSGSAAYLREMDWMERHHPTYYFMLVANITQRRGPAEIRRMMALDPDKPEEISYANTKVRLHRAKTMLRKRLREHGVTAEGLA